jgi:hypothetical protein
VKTKQSTTSNQSTAQKPPEQGTIQQSNSSRRGISSLVHSYSRSHVRSVHNSNKDEDEDDDERRQRRGKYERNVDPFRADDESITSDSSSSDDLNSDHEENLPDQIVSEPVSASDSLFSYFQHTADEAMSHPVAEAIQERRPQTALPNTHPPSYLRSTRSSTQRGQVTKENENEQFDRSDRPTTMAQFSPFGPPQVGPSTSTPRESSKRLERIPSSLRQNMSTTPTMRSTHPSSKPLKAPEARPQAMAENGKKAATSRPVSSYSTKRRSNGFFEKFSGRVRRPDEKTGWGSMIEDRFGPLPPESVGDSDLLNQSESRNVGTRSSSRGRVNSHPQERDASVRRSLSPSKLANIARLKIDPTPASMTLPPSINSLLKQAPISQLHRSIPSHRPSPPSSTTLPLRSRTPDEMKHHRDPTPDTQRRNQLTDAAEWSRMSDWLNSIHMERYSEDFQRGGVTKLSVVELLQFHDLVQLNIHRRDIAQILSHIEEMTQRTKSFTDQAPLQFLPPQKQSSTETIDTPTTTTPQQPQLRPRIFLSQRRNSTDALSDRSYYLISSSPSPRSVIDEKKLFDDFDQRNRSQFFLSWYTLKEMLLSSRVITTIAHEIIEQIHPLEFYLSLFFTVSSSPHTAALNMTEFKLYLETLMRASDEDPSVAQLLNSRLYATYGAIVLVPHPRSNPAFTHLYDDKWAQGIRKRLENFVNQLRRVTISSSDYHRLQPHSQIGLGGVHDQDPRSPTGSETVEQEMIQVLNTLEASEKLHKVLRESGQSGSNAKTKSAANATKQYRASVPKEYAATTNTSSVTPLQMKMKGRMERAETRHQAPPPPAHCEATGLGLLDSRLKGRRMSAVLGCATVTVENGVPGEDSSDDENLSLPKIADLESDDSEADEEDQEETQEEEEEEEEYDFSREKDFVNSFGIEDSDPNIVDQPLGCEHKIPLEGQPPPGHDQHHNPLVSLEEVIEGEVIVQSIVEEEGCNAGAPSTIVESQNEEGTKQALENGRESLSRPPSVSSEPAGDLDVQPIATSPEVLETEAVAPLADESESDTSSDDSSLEDDLFLDKENSSNLDMARAHPPQTTSDPNPPLSTNQIPLANIRPFGGDASPGQVVPVPATTSEPSPKYIQYLKGNFRGLEKTKSQRIRESSLELTTESDLQKEMGRGSSQIAIHDSPVEGEEGEEKGEGEEEEESDGSVDESQEFCTPLQLQNLTNRGSFVVMTKEEEELARQRSFDSEESYETTSASASPAILKGTGTGSGTLRLFRALPSLSSHSPPPLVEDDPSSAPPSLETKKSNLSELINKFNEGKGRRPEEIPWDGWELIGSRWIKKNPISEEELEAAAAFYSTNTRRHNTTTTAKKKMKRHSSAEMSSFVTDAELLPTPAPRGRGRSRSEFWEEPMLLRQLSSDAGSADDPLTPGGEQQEVGEEQGRQGADLNQPSEESSKELEPSDDIHGSSPPSPELENKIEYDLL